jgi:hypothetical protein
MFLLPSLVVGIALAALLGGRPARLLDLEFRERRLVIMALALQIVLFTGLGHGLGDTARSGLHLVTYAMLLAFAAANLRLRSLAPLFLGLVLNAAAIVANGGQMPVSSAAARAAGFTHISGSNVSESARRLRFLGDVFALPASLPLSNVFSIGDILIGLGMVTFVVFVSIGEGGRGAVGLSHIVEPLRVRSYRRLATGKLISCAGDWLTLAALVGWIYGRSGSTGQVAGLMLVRLAPPILGSGVAAFVVDRLPKAKVLVWVELARGAIVICALAGVLVHSVLLVFVAIALSGALAAVSRAALPALLPAILPAEHFSAANASLGIAEDGAIALGALVAGLTISSVGTTPALAGDLVTFALAAAIFASLRLPAVAPIVSETQEHLNSGFSHLRGHLRLLLLIGSFAAATFATGLVSATLPRLLDSSLAFGPGGYAFGVAALSLGLAAGQGFVGFVRIGESAARWIGAGLVWMAALFCLLGLTTHAPTALLLLGSIGFVDGTTDVVFKTILQRETDPRHYGAVFGFSGASIRTTMIAGVLVAPLVNGFMSPGGVALVASTVLLAAAAIALAGAWQRARVIAVAPA